MIDYSSYKKYFTPGGEFTLSGSDYIGYVEIFNGVPCEFSTRKTLAPSQTFATDILTSEYFYDRLINDEISLPYSFTDIEIGPNDHLNFNLIKDRLTKLRENNAYTFSRLFIPNNNIPVTDRVTFAAIKNDEDTNFTLFTAFEGNIAFEYTSFFNDLAGVKNFVGKKNTDLFNNFTFFCITDTKFITLTSNEIETSIIEVSNKYETVENELQFKDLRGITVNDKHLFITDAGNNVVIKYEVEGYFNNDYALSNKRNFIEVLGGEGSVVDLSRFNAPAEIACNNKYVAVHDSGNYIIKIFDVNFNYVRQLRGMPLRTEQLAAIEFNPNNNMFYALTYYEENNLKLYVYSSDFVLLEQYILNIKLDGDKVRNITFSQNDSNFWYICTNGYVYKRLVNRPDASLGRFQSQNLFANNVDTLHGKAYNNFRTCRSTQYQEFTSIVEETTRSFLGTSTEIQSFTSIRTTDQTELSSFSSVTIDPPFNTVRENIFPISTEFLVASSTVGEPLIYESTERCANSRYYTYEDAAPTNNYWNYTDTDFGSSFFNWNSRTVDIDTYEQTIIRPLKYYRFVMYGDTSLTEVWGGDSRNGAKFTGLKNIKLNVASQPFYNQFNGLDNGTVTINPPIYVEDTYDVHVKTSNILKTAPIGDYTVSTYASVTGNYGTHYKDGYTVFYSDATKSTGWTPSVLGSNATRDTAYLEIALPGSISLSSIQIQSINDDNITTPVSVEVLGSNNGVTFVPIASAYLDINPTKAGRFVDIDVYEDVDFVQTIIDTPTRTVTPLSSIGEQTSNVTTITTLSADGITPLYHIIQTNTTEYNFYVDDVITATYGSVLSSKNYTTATDTISTNPNNIISDTYRACRALPCTENYDDVILFSNGRIYFIKESNEYKSVIKSRNYKNFGLNAFSLHGDEYIQASTINKELYKVLHDIFTLKNNIVGRFSGKFDTDGVIVLDDYNYNVDFLGVTGQMFENGYLTQTEFEKYFINENEKSIVGVLNRALSNIYDLQTKLFEITQADTQTNIIPIYNPDGCEILI